jgi:uncharacterized repeat protein (TIGR03803 family)
MRRSVLIFLFWFVIATSIAASAQTFIKVADFGTWTPLTQATDGNFYGTTPAGGDANYGTVFRMTPDGKQTRLHSFSLAEGGTPWAPLVQGTDGNLYGGTSVGGAHNYGTIFKITRDGTLTTLYSFCAQQNCTDGTGGASLMQATDGKLYGETPGGGDHNAGTFFRMSLQGQLTTLHSFNVSDGFGGSSLVEANDGNFYGTSFGGGATGRGTVYKITREGTLTTLYSFCPTGLCGSEGLVPNGGLVQGADGNFYGTTYSGGTDGQGTVFKITPEGSLTTIHSFCMRCADGSTTSAGLVQGNDGDFYGTTWFGGLKNYGTLFKITPEGTLTTLHSFCSEQYCSDGEEPRAELVQATDGSLYGTAPLGGLNGSGTFFKLTAPPVDLLYVVKNGSGTVTSSDSHINCGGVCSYEYPPNAQVTLTANPSPGWLYASWYGCDNLNGNVCTVTMNKLRTVTANFVPTYPLTVAKVGNGTVTSGDGHIHCGSTCSYSYRLYTDVTLIATPDSGWVFTSWSGCDKVNNNVCTVTMNSPRKVTATFTATYKLTASKSGNGLVTSSDGFINCGSNCSHTYIAGKSVTLTASPDQNWVFKGWSGCENMNGNVCTVTMNSARNVTATFTPPHPLNVAYTGNGSITSSDGYINCGSSCSHTYRDGSVVNLTAAPGQGWGFASWSGCDQTRANACLLTMNADRAVAATFKLLYPLSVSKSGEGTVSSSDGHIYCGNLCSYSYVDGTPVTLSALPSSGSTFTGWTGCDNANGSYCSVTVAGAKNVAATFTATNVTLTSLTFKPSYVKGGQLSAGTLMLSAPAPPGGVTVALSSDHPGVAHPPSFVFVPGGNSSMQFAVQTFPVKSNTMVKITATAGSSQVSGTFMVGTTSLPPSLK